jgi:hypothetical protein
MLMLRFLGQSAVIFVSQSVSLPLRLRVSINRLTE